MRSLAVLLLTTSLVQAAPVTVTLSDEEQRALIQLLDIAAGGGKPGGLELAKATVYFVNKLQQAAQSPKPETTPPPLRPPRPEPNK